MPFIPLEKIGRLKNGYARTFAVAGRQVLLVHSEGRSFAIDNTCPHDGSSLARGTVKGGCIRCPKHGIRFDLATGIAQGGEVVEGIAALRRHVVLCRGVDVGIEIP
jgi:3-phenylpropionate/trans-cinnamate dioxygenase ferredoxin subunit